MKKNKLCFGMVVGVVLIICVTWGVLNKFNEEQFGIVMSEEEICNRIRYIRKEIEVKLCKKNYEKRESDYFNIDLVQNTINNRSQSSWYEENFVDEKGTLITITYSVECSVLWVMIEMSGQTEDFSIEEYEMLISFYQEYTNGNIPKDKMLTLIESKDFQIGEYRIDSDNYPDIFSYEVKKNGRFCFVVAGIAK